MTKNKSTVQTNQAGSSREPETRAANEASNADASEPVDYHPEFFLDDALVTVQVEKTLFGVHKHLLAKSEIFSEKFNKSKGKGKLEEGPSRQRPIKLKDVSASDFAALLRVLYASHFSSNPPTIDAPLIIPALRLASTLRFLDLCAFLLPLAEKQMNDVDKIVFARELHIKEWLAPAHIRLCQRETTLSGEEARKLGIDSVLIISRMREQHRNRPSFTVNCNYCSSCAAMTYTGRDYDCNACGGGSGVFRYHGLGRVARGGVRTDNSAIEAGVKKWVEAGCIIAD